MKRGNKGHKYNNRGAFEIEPETIERISGRVRLLLLPSTDKKVERELYDKCMPCDDGAFQI